VQRCYAWRVSGPGPAAGRDAQEARALLIALIESAYGSADEARAAFDRALRSADRKELPASIPDMLAFVRTGLLPVLSEDLGPRLTMTLMEEFVATHEIRSSITAKDSAVRTRVTKARHLRVLLVDADRVGRVTLARGLARETCLVTIAVSIEELGEIVRSGEQFDAALVDDQHPARLLLMEMIVDSFPGVSLVVRSTAEEATRDVLHALGVARFEVVPVGGSPDALVAAVVRVAAGEPRR
jgi:CheY-like chemotaxis protein